MNGTQASSLADERCVKCRPLPWRFTEQARKGGMKERRTAQAAPLTRPTGEEGEEEERRNHALRKRRRLPWRFTEQKWEGGRRTRKEGTKAMRKCRASRGGQRGEEAQEEDRRTHEPRLRGSWRGRLRRSELKRERGGIARPAGAIT